MEENDNLRQEVRVMLSLVYTSLLLSTQLVLKKPTNLVFSTISPLKEGSELTFLTILLVANMLTNLYTFKFVKSFDK